MNSRRLVDRGQGFTLVELLVILAMIGIVMLIGVPTFQQLIHRTKIESITRETAKLMTLTGLRG